MSFKAWHVARKPLPLGFGLKVGLKGGGVAASVKRLVKGCLQIVFVFV